MKKKWASYEHIISHMAHDDVKREELDSSSHNGRVFYGRVRDELVQV
jgi:hypothetical protein